MLKLMGDFETTTDINDARVWASCLVNIDSLEVVDLSNDIEGLFNYIRNKNCEIYYHNLKFDGEFIISYLLKNGFTYSEEKVDKTFSTLISDTGVFYSITIVFKKHKKKYLKAVIYDSLKKLPFKVTHIAKAFKLEESKLTIDYHKPRPIGYEITPEERDYIIADCMIVAKALKHQFSEGLTRMTVGSDALHNFKDGITKQYFEKWFPVLPYEVDKDIRRSYKGGYTYLNPKYKGKRLKGMTYDVNSLYPHIMKDYPLPYGYPIYYEGEHGNDTNYPLFIQRIRCEFEVKKKHLPTIQLKNNRAFIETEYLKNSGGDIVELTLTNVDLKLFLDHYDVYNLEYIAGWKFKKCKGVFDDYINYWAKVKAESTGGKRELAKLMLNSLYG